MVMKGIMRKCLFGGNVAGVLKSYLVTTRDVKKLKLTDQLYCQIFALNLFHLHCCMGLENVCE